MSCLFQMNSTVIQLHIYLYILFYRFFFLIGYYKILSIIPCANTVGPYWLSVLFIVVCICSSQPPNLSLSSLLPFGNYKCFLCLWVYFCLLNKFILIFSLIQTPHINNIIWSLSVSGLFHLSMNISRSSTLLQMASFRSFNDWVTFHYIHAPHLLYLLMDV